MRKKPFNQKINMLGLEEVTTLLKHLEEQDVENDRVSNKVGPTDGYATLIPAVKADYP